MTGATPLIYNPRSGAGRGPRIAVHAQTLLDAHGIRTKLMATQGPGGARPLARRLAEEGADEILVIGGDGTLSEAADGVLTAGKPVTLGFLPGGTGNAFLRDFGEPTLEAAIERVRRCEPKAIDVGIARDATGEDRHFINVFGTGFLAKACDFANRRLKWLGNWSYNAAVVPELARLAAPMTRLVVDGTVIERPMVLVSVCNTKFTGAGLPIAPMAVHDDGLLDVLVLDAVNRRRLLSLFSMLMKGTHIGQEGVTTYRGKEIEIAPADPSVLLADGEIYGSTPSTIRVLPGAIRVYA